jgi:hypothetical protein
MEKKIIISTVQQTCDVQVLNINAYLVAKVINAKIKLQDKLKEAEYVKQHRDPETKEWVDDIDENGNTIKEWRTVDGNMLKADVMPLLEELAEAFLS